MIKRYKVMTLTLRIFSITWVLIFCTFALGWSQSISDIENTKLAPSEGISDILVSRSSQEMSVSSINQIISIDFQDVPLLEAMKQVTNDLGMRLSYSKEVLPIDKEVTVYFENTTANEVIYTLLEGTGLRYAVSEKGSLIIFEHSKELRRVQTYEQSQQSVTGTLIDGNSGETLPGVNVLVKGTTTGTSTDSEGNFELTVESLQDTLVVSFVGYQTQEVPIDGRTQIDIQLSPEAIMGDEMVVIGYGSVRRNDLTGAVSQVSSEDIERVPAVNPLMALQGHVPGMKITPNSGEPGASASIRIRGDQSISGSNSPIFVVDGSITTDIDNINSDDIESVTVLKDASTVAIYGSRAANGVIQITTKRGSSGRDPVFNLHTYSGIQQSSNLDVELLNADEWLRLYTEAHENAEVTPNWTDDDLAKYEGIDTDWLDVIRRTGYQYNTDLSVAGGSEKSNYYISTGIANNKGMVEGLDYSRYNLRLNTDHEINNWISFGNSLNIFTSNTSGSVGQYQRALMKVPLTRNFEDDGGWGIIRNTNLEHQYSNPLWMAQNTASERNQKGLIGNLYLTLTFLDNFEFTARGNMEWTNDYRSNFTPGANPVWQWEDPTTNALSKDNRETLHWVTDFLLEYDKSFGEDHQLSGMLGYSVEEQTYERLYSSGQGTPTNEIRYLNAADPTSITSNNSFSDWAFKSQFGRIGYTYKDKYTLGATVRRDGTSRLDEANRYGIFPSVSAAWRMGEEQFLESVDWLNEFKLRVSWGTVGNVLSIGTYGTQASLTNWNYARNNEAFQGYTLASAVNTDLVWESTEKKNFGFDLEIFDNRIYAIADFYVEDTRDLLFAQPIPNSTGLSGNPYINAGHIKNTGIELEFGYRYQAQNWNYSLGANVTTASNEVIDLEGRDLKTSGIVEGKSLRSFYGYKTNGIIRSEEQLNNNPHRAGKEVGDIWFVDENGDGVVDADDRTILASRYPDLTYGLTGTVGYKKITVNVQLQGIQGITRNLLVGGNLGTLHYFTQFPKNHDRLILDRFHETRNPDGEFPKIDLADTGDNISTASDFWLRDASYLRISNLNVNYDFSTSFTQTIGIRKLGVYTSVHNLYTFTSWYGPEVDTNADELTGVPQPRTWTLGLKVSF
ncbi:TonB-linked outer membrane protein, SusC/RagA family [Fodinibius roseus]|uniref:TonB-linked outer membrane protein, SusC/RagA family n=1 Tax=Fodinibius roseus TaxID=1194090 RepID=A0A1M4UNP0_9BACT|nr:TonB-dependent receptor [Fodinibius roseus]SHE58278.1 TonB-linked outer membrane protein, SusC/RagA family [Fodinibius roseus]